MRMESTKIYLALNFKARKSFLKGIQKVTITTLVIIIYDGNEDSLSARVNTVTGILTIDIRIYIYVTILSK